MPDTDRSATMTANRLISVGYEGRDVDELIRMLVDEGVATVVDVRMTPISRKPGLSKTKLSAALSEAGIRYVHLKNLGNPRDNRALFRDGGASGRVRFAEVLNSKDAKQALETVQELLVGGPVALLCFERDHSTCHRSMVASAISSHRERMSLVQL